MNIEELATQKPVPRKGWKMYTCRFCDTELCMHCDRHIRWVPEFKTWAHTVDCKLALPPIHAPEPNIVKVES